MKTFNLNSDEWDGTRDSEGWRVKAALVGQRIGGELIGATMSEVEPGSRLWPYHTHHLNEEWVIVLRGEPTLRTPEGERVLNEGDVVCFPRGKDGAHQIINRTDSPIRVLMLSSMVRGEIIEYLDTGKILAKDVEDEDILFARPGPRSSTGKARTSSGPRSPDDWRAAPGEARRRLRPGIRSKRPGMCLTRRRHACQTRSRGIASGVASELEQRFPPSDHVTLSARSV